MNLQTVAVSKSGVFLVFEYCPHELAQLVDAHYQRKHRSPFTLAQVKTLQQQLLSALEFVHRHALIHRDIKLSSEYQVLEVLNSMLSQCISLRRLGFLLESDLLYQDATGQLKVADFGLSRSYPSRDDDDCPLRLLTQPVASLWYRPPELLLQSPVYTRSMDLWATGCILAELLHGTPYWNGNDEEEQIKLIFESLGLPSAQQLPILYSWPKMREQQQDWQHTLAHRSRPSSTGTILDDFSSLSMAGLRLLTQGLLHLDPTKRWTAREALQSPWFSEEPRPTAESQMPRFLSQHASLD